LYTSAPFQELLLATSADASSANLKKKVSALSDEVCQRMACFTAKNLIELRGWKADTEGRVNGI